MAPVAKLHQPCTALHTTTFLGVSAQLTTQNGGASAKFPAAKFTTAHLTWHGTPPPPWMHLVSGMGNSPSPGQPTPGVVKQDKSSGGSVDTTKTRSGPQRVRMSSGERPMGAAKGKQSDNEALCHPPHPLLWYCSAAEHC